MSTTFAELKARQAVIWCRRTGLAKVAGHVSLDEGSRNRQGDLGWLERGQLAGALEQAIFAALPGKLIGPVESEFGWHLLVVEAIRPGGIRPFAECREEIIAELVEDRRLSAWREWWQRRLAEAVTASNAAHHPLLPASHTAGHKH